MIMAKATALIAITQNTDAAVGHVRKDGIQ